MEAAYPPSYEDATDRDPWRLIAPYLESPVLCCIVLVSRQWHQTFAPYLWGNPASHFGTENDRVYVVLTRFKRSLPYARRSVRQLTHTLHLPPATPEIYEGPHADWLRGVLEQLPNLQSLIVSGLSFFDHASLLSVSTPTPSAPPGRPSEPPIYPLRLLIASACNNTTANSISRALMCWPDLVYLDLSNTLAARDHAILRSMAFMHNLQVLKLRHVQLRDDDMHVLARAIGLRLRSLDVRDNHITDSSILLLLSTCIHPQRNVHGRFDPTRALIVYEDWPSGFPRPPSQVLEELRSENLDKRFLKRLTQGVVHRLPSEDLPSTGISHLYIANNPITVEGVASLIRSENLYLLDAGSLDPIQALGRARARSSANTQLGYTEALPGPEKLSQDLEKHAKDNLAALRIHHAVLTVPILTKENSNEPLELHHDSNTIQELHSTERRVFEMAAAPPLYELSGEAAAPRHELIRHPFKIIETPLSGGRAIPNTSTPDQVHDVRRNSIFAPEVVDEEADEPICLTATGFGPGFSLDKNPRGNELQRMSSCDTNNNHLTLSNMNIPMLIAHRQSLRSRFPATPHNLLPGLLPALRTIVLTDVPPLDRTGTVTTNLQAFIGLCASEARLAKLQAMLEYPMSKFDPHRHRARRARKLFALRRIVLEMSPLRSAQNSFSAPLTSRTMSNDGIEGRPWPRSFTVSGLSVTDESDTETLWKAAENDFSFFGEEECGLPESDSVQRPNWHASHNIRVSVVTSPASTMSGNAFLSPTMTRTSVHGNRGESKDVVSELARWRQERKRLWKQAGPCHEGLDAGGYWEGEIKVIRPGTAANGQFEW